LAKNRSAKFPPDEWLEVTDPDSRIDALLRAIKALEKGEVPDEFAAQAAARFMTIKLAAEAKHLLKNPKLEDHPSAFLLRDLARTSDTDQGGRGRFLDYANRSYLVGSVKGARANGLKGDRVFECAACYLGKTIGEKYEPESVRRLYYKHHKNYPIHPSVLDIWASDLEKCARKYKGTKPA
jgi:hypothetical protein